MSELANTRSGARPELFERQLVWQWPIRLFHWAFAGATTVLFVTGLYINYPWFTVSGSTDAYLMGWVRWSHFVAAAVFTVAYAWRIVWFFLGNRHARSGFPCFWSRRWWRDVVGQALAYLRFDFRQVHTGHNALAGASYAFFAVGLGLGQIVTGFALFGESNPGGACDSLFGWALPVFGGSFRTHMWHDLFAWGFALFVILHVYIVLLDDSQYRNGLVSSMVSGDKFVRPGHRDEDDHA